jgi:hypothetical protein
MEGIIHGVIFDGVRQRVVIGRNWNVNTPTASSTSYRGDIVLVQFLLRISLKEAHEWTRN